MAKEHGLGAALYLDGVDLSGDTQAVPNITKSLSPIPMTGINKKAFERKGGVLDGSIQWTSYFNPTNAHLKLDDLPRIDVVASYFHKDDVLGTPVASMVSKQTTYDPTRGADGSLTASVNTLANQWWLDWGYSLTTGKRTDTAAANGTGVDFTDPSPAAYSYGLQAYLHVFAFTGTNVTIKLQQSSDNGVGDAWADVTGGAFTVVTSAPQAQRLATARDQAVERYLRVVTTGTFTSVQFAVSAVINITEMTI